VADLVPAAAERVAAPVSGGILAAAAGLSFSRGLAQALIFITTVLMTRAFDVADYGRYVFAQALASVFIFAVDHGAQFHLVQRVARAASGSEQIFARSWAARNALALLALPVIVAVVWALDSSDPRRAIVTGVMLVGAWWDADTLLAFAAFRATGRIARESLWTTAGAVLRLAITAAGIGARMAFLPFLVGLTAGKLTAAAAALVDARRSVRFPWLGTRGGLGPHLRDALPFTLFALTGVMYYQLGTVLVSAFSGHREAAVFQVGFMLFLGGLFVPDAVANANYPRLSHSFANDPARYREDFRRLCLRLGQVGVLLGGGLALLGPAVVGTLFPAAYAGASMVARSLGAALFLRCLSTAYGTGLHAGNGERARARNNLLALVALVALGPWSVRRLGATGMAWALVATEALLLVLEYLSTRGLRGTAKARRLAA